MECGECYSMIPVLLSSIANAVLVLAVICGLPQMWFVPVMWWFVPVVKRPSRRKTYLCSLKYGAGCYKLSHV